MVKPEEKSAPLPPNTTVQEDKVVEGQRTINYIWENNQARIAWLIVVVGAISNLLVIFIVLAVIFVTVIFDGKDITANQLALLLGSVGNIATTSGIIIGFYFGRTNHVNTGGVGPKTGEPR